MVIYLTQPIESVKEGNKRYFLVFYKKNYNDIKDRLKKEKIEFGIKPYEQGSYLLNIWGIQDA